MDSVTYQQILSKLFIVSILGKRLHKRGSIYFRAEPPMHAQLTRNYALADSFWTASRSFITDTHSLNMPFFYS
jgi:hypothetical protein